jgi:hypothetical protein
MQIYYKMQSPYLEDEFSDFDYPSVPTGEINPWPKAPTQIIMPHAPKHYISLSAIRNNRFNAYVAELLETVRYCERTCNRTHRMTQHINTIAKLAEEIVALDNRIISQKGGRRRRTRNRRNRKLP